jgi:hypothetical protein
METAAVSWLDNPEQDLINHFVLRGYDAKMRRPVVEEILHAFLIMALD